MEPANLSIRPARLSDRERVVEMTRDVWEGNDYIPFIWDTWATQAHGVVLVAEMSGRIVGLQNQYLQNSRLAWIEGIRVDSALRGRGIAKSLLRAGIRWATWHGCDLCRLTTASENPASNRLAEEAGFRRLTSFDALQSEPDPSSSMDVPYVRLGRSWEVETVVDILRDPTHSGTCGIAMKGWTAEDVTEGYIRSRLGMNSVLVFDDATIRGACVVACHPPFNRIQLEAFVGDADAVAALGTYLRARQSEHDVRAFVALPEASLNRLLASGYRRAFEFKVNLYELDLTQRMLD